MEGYCNSPIIISTNGYAQSGKFYFPCMALRINGNKNIEFNAECSSDKEVRFDVSSYAKGILYNSTISPASNVPSTIMTYQIFQKDYTGNYNERTNEGGSVTAYLGRGDSLSRFRATAFTDTSYKPTSTEVVNTGDYYITRGQTTPVTKVVDTDCSGVYIEDNQFRHQIIFLNSFGRWESASALTRESKQYKYSNTETEIDDTFPDNIGRPNIITTKYMNEVIWSMSSGYVTYEWAEWWAKEVMSAEFVWIKEVKADGTSVLTPVTLIPDDSTTILQKSKADLCHVDFKIKFK